MGRRGRLLAAGWLALWGVAACSHSGALSSGSLSAIEADDRWQVVRGVPLVRQTTDADCGAAALAMVLTHGGRFTTAKDVTTVYPPEPEKGILAGHLRAFARTQGFSAFLVSATIADLERELSRGRPVLVGLVKRAQRRAYSHYEIVVGRRRDGQAMLLLDPARGARQAAVADFTAEWQLSGSLALMVVPSRVMPASN